MISLWQMVKGRIAGAIAAGLVGLLGLLGLSELIGLEEIAAIEAIANGFVTILSFIAYGVYHQWATKRKLQNGELAQENVEKLYVHNSKRK